MNSTPLPIKSETQLPVFQAKEATPETRELYDLGKKMIENSLESVQEILKQLLTLATALLGGSVAFMNEQLMPLGFKAFVVLAFLASVGIAFWGMMPYPAENFSPNLVQSVPVVRSKALKWKLSRLKVGGLFLFLGFVVACAGLVVRALSPLPPH
jgi:hypothetical protein